ncbi:hypothetical protein AOQ84DRAFT_141225 [Glonium stellatum]|uniref:Uncharacterized protein n=1 Tax=Glonium stellatum TaxID=574774 RepID=A0A8E2F9X2_9PEZI|nr:hypothetical protein AOQ84DRAFT_141225 [Glonium stellatum]
MKLPPQPGLLLSRKSAIQPCGPALRQPARPTTHNQPPTQNGPELRRKRTDLSDSNAKPQRTLKPFQIHTWPKVPSRHPVQRVQRSPARASAARTCSPFGPRKGQNAKGLFARQKEKGKRKEARKQGRKECSTQSKYQATKHQASSREQ